MKNTRTYFCLFLIFSFASFARGMVIEGRESNGSERNLNVEDVLSELKQSGTDIPNFPYSSHVGVVGMGSGVYLGDGWVLTSAHVGCHNFIHRDGSHFVAVKETWTPLKNGEGKESDLAVFQIRLPYEGSSLSDCGPLPVSNEAPAPNDRLVLAGTGFIQQKTPATLTSHGKVLATLGYRTRKSRGVTWGVNTLSSVLTNEVKTGNGFLTQCFTTEFGRSKFEAQAAEGDSGGATFVWSQSRQQWELAGCIIAVTQKGNYVPYGSKTFSANLARYRDQLPVAVPARELNSNNQLVAEKVAVDSSSEFESDEIGVERVDVIELPAALYASVAAGC